MQLICSYFCRPHWLQSLTIFHVTCSCMKAVCKIYKGIEYVQLNELPVTQQFSLLESQGEQLFIKILVDGKILSRCIQYKDYSFWYENVYKTKPALVSEARIPQAVALEADLALNKV